VILTERANAERLDGFWLPDSFATRSRFRFPKIAQRSFHGV